MTPNKMPTLLGLAIVAALVGTVIYAGERFAIFSSLFANRGVTVQRIEITNGTDASLSISWTTESPTIGNVSVSGGTIRSRVVLDDRDSPTKKSPTTTHHVTIRDLSPDTHYQITIQVNGRNAQGSVQPVTTGPTLAQALDNSLGPAYGSVVSETGQPAAGALVYVTIEGGQKLSTLVTPSGSWLIPLNRMRTADGSQYLEVAERMAEDIIVRPGSTDETAAITDTLNDSPVPAMAIGKSYDFRKQQAQAPKQPTVLGSSTVSLLAPKQGNAIPSTLPLIHGTGISGKTVVLTLGINNPWSDTTIVNSDGTWRYTPKKPLGIGKQSVTMTSLDASGKTVAVTHLFEILKSGTQVLGDATPSATLEPSPTPQESPTPESTLAGEPIPTSGSMLPTIIIVFASLGLLIAGGALLAL